MTSHKRNRRAIRRLTRRKIPLPTASQSSTPPAQLELSTPVANDIALERGAASGSAAKGGTVASSLAELRLPGDKGASAEAGGAKDANGSAAPAAESRTPSEPAVDVELGIVEEGAEKAFESQAAPEGEEETTSPQIRVDESLEAAHREAESRDADGGKAKAAARAGEGANGVEAANDEADVEPVTGQHPKQSAPPARRPDSDAPTRPRIELSSEMALAAGRVTSLEVPPVLSDQPPKRGSKLPPPGERMVSSLTGRRSSAFPASSDEEEASARPAVVVTRSRIISDRPPKLLDAETIKSARFESAKRDSAEPRKRPTIETAKQSAAVSEDVKLEQPGEAKGAAGEDRAGARESDIPEPETAEIVKVDVPEPTLPSLRPSRRPTAEGEEFETLDIEDSDVETHSLRAEPEIDADFDEDEPAKAPPPPPQQKRAGGPPAAPAPPKAAPPPPPRVQGPAPLAAAASSAAVATSLPAPTMPGNSPVAAVASSSAGSGTAAAASNSSASGGSSSRKSGSRPQPRRRQWWETLFSDDYLRTVVRPTAQQITRQVDFMQASLGVSKGAAVLDVGCGLGQHALEFARRGCLVVALDLALPMITRAAEDAQQEGLRINFLHKDIRDIGFEGTFDAVVCVGTTFGFFDDEQNREVLGRLANALKPGGRLLLEVVNRDHVLLSQPNLQWFEGEGCVVMEESDFNYYSSRLTVKRTMMREDGRQTESEYSIRLYALHELGQMMQAAGFRVKEVSGGQATRGVFFGAHSSRIILLAERRTPAASRGNNGHASDAPPAES
jgi:SAM-dependent methyltransferase